MRNDNERLFEGFERPLAPPGLRERTLRAAGSALVRHPQKGIWGMLWDSMWLRLAWAGVVAVLLVSHLVISTAGDPGSHVPSMPGRLVAVDYGNELAEIVDLPRIIALRPSLMGSRYVNAGLGERTSEGDVS